MESGEIPSLLLYHIVPGTVCHVSSLMHVQKLVFGSAHLKSNKALQIRQTIVPLCHKLLIWQLRICEQEFYLLGCWQVLLALQCMPQRPQVSPIKWDKNLELLDFLIPGQFKNRSILLTALLKQLSKLLVQTLLKSCSSALKIKDYIFLSAHEFWLTEFAVSTLWAFSSDLSMQMIQITQNVTH